MPLKKSIRAKKSTRLQAFMRLKKYTRLTGGIRAGAIAVVVISVIAAVMLIAAHLSSSPADIARPGQPGKTAASVAPAAGADAARTPAADATAANTPATEPAAKTPVPKSAPVTITGCLERADETFLLKDTTGVDAPKSRSWKSGFLKKSPTSIAVVDAANRLKLPDHVGQRVSVTGTLVAREMQVRSLQRVGASCTNSPRVRT